MTDQTNGPRPGADQVGDSAGEPAPNRDPGKNGFFQVWTTLDVHHVGLLIFALSTTAILLVAILALIFDALGTIEGTSILRLIEPMLAIAGAALVIVFITPKGTNPFVIIFGIILIGALIVPTTDLIRFSLIVSGSDRKFQDFFVQTAGGKSQIARDQDVAQKILNELGKLDAPFDNLLRSQRTSAANAITKILVDERNQQILDRVRQRGSLPLLKRVTDNTHEDWIFRFSSNEKFNDDLNFLRNEGLIEFSYDDRDTIRPTELGVQVANRAKPTSRGGDLDDLNILDRLSGLLGNTPRPKPPQDLGKTTTISSDQFLNFRTGTIGSDFEWFQFTPKETGEYRISVSSVELGVDGYASLINPKEDEDKQELDSSDDTESSLNPRIVHDLKADTTYLLGIRTVAIGLGKESGEYRVEILRTGESTRGADR